MRGGGEGVSRAACDDHDGGAGGPSGRCFDIAAAVTPPALLSSMLRCVVLCCAAIVRLPVPAWPRSTRSYLTRCSVLCCAVLCCAATVPAWP